MNIKNHDAAGYFLRASSDILVTNGNNGGKITLKTSSQNITGNILVDSVYTLTMTLPDSSAFNGAVNTSGQTGTVKIIIDEGCEWTLTENSYISSLTNNGTHNQGEYTLYVNGTAYDGSSNAAGDDTSGDAIVITATVLKPAIVGKSYSMTLKVSGANPPIIVSWKSYWRVEYVGQRQNFRQASSLRKLHRNFQDHEQRRYRQSITSVEYPERFPKDEGYFFV